MQFCTSYKWQSLLYVGCSFFAIHADAEVIDVPGDQPTIQAGIDAAGIGDEVVLADGIYRGPGNRNLDFGGKLITVRSANGPENCIIDCEYAGRGFIFHSGESSESSIMGLTITHGSAITPEYGGGIMCENSSPTIANCLLLHNVAAADDYWPTAKGGGLYCINSSPTLLQCTFHHNHSDDFMKNSDGGGMYCSSNSHPTLTGCSFTENTAIAGGGLYLTDGSSATLIDCAFSGNIAYFSDGGGIAVWGADLTIIDCVFVQNYAEPGGGGMNASLSTVYAEGCLFHDNSEGGASVLYSESVFVNCRFIGNRACEGGGLAVKYWGTTTLRNCLFSGNRAECGSYPDARGGAMYNVASDLSLINCTLSGNTAALGLAGGMYNVNSTPKLTNCILWGNSDSGGAGESAQFYMAGGWAGVDYSCIQGLTGDFGGIGNIGADPLFVDPDGPDDVMGTQDDDLHLQPDSPAVNTGEPCLVPDEAPTDLDGEERIQHCRVDMGADESPYFVLVDCNENGVLDACDAAEGPGPDCNCNGVLDECDITDGTSADCNGNGSPDACDLSDQSSLDCNNNAVPDECDLVEQSSMDCNDNDVPDECDVVQMFADQSEPLSPLGGSVPLIHTIPSPPPTVDDVTLSFEAVGDLVSPEEVVAVLINSVLVGQIFETGAVSCSSSPNTAQLTVSAEEFNSAIDGGDAEIMLFPSPPVDEDACFGESYITVAIQYAFSSPADTDGSGIPDECEAGGDLDGDGNVGPVDLAMLLGSWGPCGDCAACPADLDGDCTVGPGDLAILLANWG